MIRAKLKIKLSVYFIIGMFSFIVIIVPANL